MKYLLYALLVPSTILTTVVSSPEQKGKGAVAVKQDSSAIPKRPAPYRCNDAVKPAPLPWYRFTSAIDAEFNILDSNGLLTSSSKYHYYFDDSSRCAGLKNIYSKGSKREVMISIEELRDSLEFRTTTADTGLLVFNSRKNCSGRINRFHEILLKNTRRYVKTGQQKTIHGYVCEAYLLRNLEQESTLWVCTANDAWLQKIRKDMVYFLPFELTGFSEGIVMASDSYFYKTKHRQVFNIVMLSKNKITRIKTKAGRLVNQPS